MTAYKDGIEFKPSWLKAPDWRSECKDCYQFEQTHCGNLDSDHYNHMILPCHKACELFEEKY